MPLPNSHRTASGEIRRLLTETKTPLTDIARQAGVAYTPLWKWVTGRQKTYNLLDGERVYFALTGRTFLPNSR